MRRSPLGQPATSVRLGALDAALLYQSEDWSGSVTYLRGAADVAQLTSAAASSPQVVGATSVQITPVSLRLSVTVVTGAHGELPGQTSSCETAGAYLRDAVAAVNSYYDRERALVRARVTRLRFRSARAQFDLDAFDAQAIPEAWCSPADVDVYLVNSQQRGGPGPRDPRVVLPLREDGRLRTRAEAARVLARELGRRCGLGDEHDPANLMGPGARGATLGATGLRPAQIEAMHARFAGELSRCVQRH